jgi:hypothetical protein
MYKARNGITNVPNLFKKAPLQSTQTGRGNVRSVAYKPVLGGVIGDAMATLLIKQKTLPTIRWAGLKLALN